MIRKLIRKYRYLSEGFSTNKQLDAYQNAQQLLRQSLIARSNTLQKINKQLQSSIDSKIHFPIKLCGYAQPIQQKYSYLPARILSYYRLHSTIITDYLLKIYKASLYAIADSNQQFMDEYWQQGLKKNVIQQLNQCKNKSYQIKVNLETNFITPIQQNIQILDSVMIRGLSINRSQNLHPSNYHKSVQSQEVGLITYTPNYLTNNNQVFINPNTNKNAYQGYDNVVLRLLIRIKTPLRLKIEQLVVDDNIYTWEHICIMQNTMVAPPQLKTSYKIQTLMEWLGKYRFGVWKLVDIDNFMKGNSLFRQHIKEQPLDPIFKGTKLDKSFYVDIRDI